MIRQVARRAHSGCQTVEIDDVEQAIWLAFSEKMVRDRILEVDGMTELMRVGTDFNAWGPAGIRHLATQVANEYVATERVNYMYWSGRFVYTPALVEGYLKDAVWKEVEDVPDIDGRADVQREFANLSLMAKRDIFHKFGLGEPPESENAPARMRIDRGIQRITDRLNMNLGTKQVGLEPYMA